MISAGPTNNWNPLSQALIPDEWLIDEPATAPSAMDQVVFGGYEGEEKNLGPAGLLFPSEVSLDSKHDWFSCRHVSIINGAGRANLKRSTRFTVRFS